MCKTLQISKFTIFCCMYKDCSKEYTSKFNLKRHVQLFHLRSKQVQCEVCHKKFRIPQNLIEHSYIHEGIKPYKCRKCGKTIRHKTTYLKHLKTCEKEHE